MAKGKGINLNLPAVDDLFTTQEQRQELELEFREPERFYKTGSEIKVQKIKGSREMER